MPPETRTVWIHKYEVQLRYGGPEEGGWYYDYRSPLPNYNRNPDCSNHVYWEPLEVSYNVYPDSHPLADDEKAYRICRRLNEAERNRQDKEEFYHYTSSLSHRSTFYTYDFHNHDRPLEESSRPHYE